MNELYKVIGISKQAVYQYQKRQEAFNNKLRMLLLEAELLRKEHPGCGVEKMYYSLNPDFIGRDRFIELFMDLGFRLNKKKNYRRTTYSVSKYYPNLIKGLEIQGPSVVWQSDITYIYVKSEERYYYAVFIIDVYTKQIVGWELSDHMRATANVKALKKALKHHQAPRIHHSDRGSQYIYQAYTELLKKNGCQISMSLIAQENAYAERIHKTIKEEYLDHWHHRNYKELRKNVSKAVRHYNTKRPHNNLGRMTPNSFADKILSIPMKERPKLIIYDDNEDNKKQTGQKSKKMINLAIELMNRKTIKPVNTIQG